MKRPLRPFLVEVKRTKRSSSSAPTLLLTEEPVPASPAPTTPEQELIARIFSGVGARDKGASAQRAAAEELPARPRILESLLPAEETGAAPENAAEAPDEAAEDEVPFGWLVHRRDGGAGARTRRASPRDSAAGEDTMPPGVILKPRRGRPPRSAASTPRVLDPSVWPEDLVTAPVRRAVEEEKPVVEVPVAAPRLQPARRPSAPREATAAKRARPVTSVREIPEVPVVEAVSAAVETVRGEKEPESRRRGAARRRGTAGELKAGQRWKKRLPKVLW